MDKKDNKQDNQKALSIKKILPIAIIFIAIISLLVFLFLKPSAEEKEKQQVIDDSHASFQQSLSEQYGEEQAQEILNKELSDEQLEEFDSILESHRIPTDEEVEEWVYSDENPDGPAIGYIDKDGNQVIFDIHEDVPALTDEEFASDMDSILEEIASMKASTNN